MNLYELPGNPGSPTRSFEKYPSYKLAEKQGLVIKHNPRMLGKSALNLYAARHWSLLPPHAVNAKSARAVGSDNATASAKLGRCNSICDHWNHSGTWIVSLQMDHGPSNRYGLGGVYGSGICFGMYAQMDQSFAHQVAADASSPARRRRLFFQSMSATMPPA